MAAFQSENWKKPSGLPEYQVIKVIDGDTIEVSELGKIRYFGIHIPENQISAEKTRLQREALKVNKKLVQGKKVGIELNAEEEDKDGWILAYVYSGSIFVNAYLIEAGYCEAESFPPNLKYTGLFKKLEEEARENKRGFWKFDVSQQELNSNGPPPDSNQVYWASKNSKKFHYPWCSQAKKINPANLIEFKNREEAVKAGYTPCKVCNP